MTGQTFTVAEQTRLTTLIPFAERDLARWTGRVFYDALLPASDASQDWLLATALISAQYLHDENPEVRAALQGPYQSEKLGDYSYTVRAGSVTLDADPRVAAIIAAYRVLTFVGLVVNGPTRVAVPVYDADLSRGLW